MRPAPLAKPAIASLILLTTAASGLAAALPAAAATGRPAAVWRPAGHHRLAFVSHRTAPPLPAGERYACPVPTTPGQMQCMSIIPTGSIKAAASGMLPNAATPAGYGPADLQSAYQLASAAAPNGAGMPVGIVDAYADPKAAADVATYRKRYGLPACTTASKCLRIVNQNGNTGPLPVADQGWAIEISLDLDMVSAICPKCKIILVEASSSSILDLGAAENTAVALGAKFVSNSWGGGEFIGEQTFDHYFNHLGVAITVAAGDLGYGTQYPADIQYVTAVGGTLLSRAKNARGWTEGAWGNGTAGQGTGSGCSAVAAKASWQTADNSFPNGCLNRTGNDVAAVASPAHGVAVYDSYALCGGWCNPGVGGTSASSPIIAATYALAGTPSAGTYPASYPYQHAAHFFDVTTGGNGMPGYTCEASRAYLCHGEVGYDGPTGVGTPNGTAGFSNAGGQRVTLLDPGTQDVLEGAAFSLRIKGYDTNAAATSLSYTETGLPAGLSVSSVTGSRDAVITGTLPTALTSYQVTVTGRDTTTGKYSSARFQIVTSAPANLTSAPAGQVSMSPGSLCLSDPGTPGGQATVVTCGSAGQSFSFQPGAAPGADGTLVSKGTGNCLGEPATGAADQSAATLQTCNSSATGQQWIDDGVGLLVNAASGLCLGDQGNAIASGTPVQVQYCVPFQAGQSWSLPAGPVVDGLNGCLTGSALGGSITNTACTAAQQSQQWTFQANGTLSVVTSTGTYCLGDGNNPGSGRAVTLEACSTTPLNDNGQIWFPGPNGQLMNNWGKCLYYPGASGAVVQQDCYGLAGEIWSIR